MVYYGSYCRTVTAGFVVGLAESPIIRLFIARSSRVLQSLLCATAYYQSDSVAKIFIFLNSMLAKTLAVSVTVAYVCLCYMEQFIGITGILTTLIH